VALDGRIVQKYQIDNSIDGDKRNNTKTQNTQKQKAERTNQDNKHKTNN